MNALKLAVAIACGLGSALLAPGPAVAGNVSDVIGFNVWLPPASGARSDLTLQFTGGVAGITGGSYAPLTKSRSKFSYSNAAPDLGFVVHFDDADQMDVVGVRLDLLLTGAPISGAVSLPEGGRMDGLIGGGELFVLHDGEFSIPFPSAVASPPPSGEVTIKDSPGSVRAGSTLRVSGNVSDRCPPGDFVMLFSRAFKRTATFAGAPAILATVRPGGHFSAHTTIPAGRKQGRYRITGRCAAGPSARSLPCGYSGNERLTRAAPMPRRQPVPLTQSASALAPASIDAESA